MFYINVHLGQASVNPLDLAACKVEVPSTSNTSLGGPAGLIQLHIYVKHFKTFHSFSGEAFCVSIGYFISIPLL